MTSKQRILLFLCILSALFALLALWSLPLRLGFIALGDLLPDADAVDSHAVRLFHLATRRPMAQLPNSTANPSNSAQPPPPPLSGIINATQRTSLAKNEFAVPSSLERTQPSNEFAPRNRAEWTHRTVSGEATKSSSRADTAAESPGGSGAGGGCAHFKHMSGREFAAAVASGALRLSDGGAQSPAVRVVHVSWKTAELPPRFARWSRTWCQCFPHWTHVLWTDADNEWLVREHYAWFHPKYAGFQVPISRVDSVRYLYLHHFGGLYTCAGLFWCLNEDTAAVFNEARHVTLSRSRAEISTRCATSRSSSCSPDAPSFLATWMPAGASILTFATFRTRTQLT